MIFFIMLTEPTSSNVGVIVGGIFALTSVLLIILAIVNRTKLLAWIRHTTKRNTILDRLDEG